MFPPCHPFFPAYLLKDRKPSKRLLNKLHLIGFRPNHIAPQHINKSDEVITSVKETSKNRGYVARQKYGIRMVPVYNQIMMFLSFSGYIMRIKDEYDMETETRSYKYKFKAEDTTLNIVKSVESEKSYDNEADAYIAMAEAVVDDILELKIKEAQELIDNNPLKKKRNGKKS